MFKIGKEYISNSIPTYCNEKFTALFTNERGTLFHRSHYNTDIWVPSTLYNSWLFSEYIPPKVRKEGWSILYIDKYGIKTAGPIFSNRSHAETTFNSSPSRSKKCIVKVEWEE